jgi:hypothetical protein
MKIESFLVAALVATSLVLAMAADQAQSQNEGSRFSDEANPVITFETGKQPTREIHVATTGSDEAGCGSLENPCASVSFVADKEAKLEPGTAVRIHEGIYTSRQRIQNQSGTAEQPIWIGGAPGENRPIFTSDWEGFSAIEIEYVILHDLEVYGTTQNGIGMSDCALWNSDDEECRADETRTHHVVFRNLYIHDVGRELSNYSKGLITFPNV